MSKRKGFISDKDTVPGPSVKRSAWTFFKSFNIASDQEFQAALSEIKPLLVTAQTVTINGLFKNSIRMSWSAFDDFKVDDSTEKLCHLIFEDPALKSSSSIHLFYTIFQTATLISRLDIIDTTNQRNENGSGSFPPLKSIMTWLARAGYWRDRLLHLKLSNFFVVQESFEDLEISYPEHLTSLCLNGCFFDGMDGICTLLTKLIRLKSCNIWNGCPPQNLQLIQVMNTAICHMMDLEDLSLIGEVDSRDEAGIETFAENIEQLKFLNKLIIYSHGSLAEDGRDNLQDKLIKVLPRTCISRFHKHGISDLNSSTPLSSDAVDALATYLSNRSTCKLHHISLDFDSSVPANEGNHEADALLVSSRLESQIVRAIEEGLSIRKFTMPIVDTRIGEREDPYRLEIRRHLWSFCKVKGELTDKKLNYILNDFYLPIINALDRAYDIPPGLWPHVLAKGKRKSTSSTINPIQNQFGPFHFAPNIHASILFVLLRERPSIICV